mgnify:CR=1 FL=1
MTALRFHDLTVTRITPEAAGAVAITLNVPADLREAFDFAPGQFLTVRATIGGADVRRSYSISSARSLLQQGELELGIRPVEGRRRVEAHQVALDGVVEHAPHPPHADQRGKASSIGQKPFHKNDR